MSQRALEAYCCIISREVRHFEIFSQIVNVVRYMQHAGLYFPTLKTISFGKHFAEFPEMEEDGNS